MRWWKWAGVAAVATSFEASAWAQVPPSAGLPGAGAPGLSPGAPGAPAAGAPGVAGTPGAGAGFAGGAPAGVGTEGLSANAGRFEKLCALLKKCKRDLCASPLGGLINNATAPISGLTGGIIPPFCPTVPSVQDAQKPGVEGAAAQAKIEEAQAKARKESVRYLGTLDCRYYPEAEVALINGLRADRNECVRFEAATALANGCCCTKNVITALEITVACEDKDGFPAEHSARVREMAAEALAHCLSCYVERPRAPEEKPKDKQKEPESPKEPTGPGKEPGAGTEPEKLPDPRPVVKAAHSEPAAKVPPRPKFVTYIDPRTPEGRMANRPGKDLIARAQKTLDDYHQSGRPRAVAHMVSPTERSLSAIIRYASDGEGSAVESAPARPMQTMVSPIGGSVISMRDGGTTPPAFQPTHVPTPVAAPRLAPVAMTMSAPPSAVPPARDEKAVVTQLVADLRDGKRAADRHAALTTVSRFNMARHPEIPVAMVHSARSDADLTVRVAAIRRLVQTRTTLPFVIEDLEALTRDADPWLSSEADKAVKTLKEIAPVSAKARP